MKKLIVVLCVFWCVIALALKAQTPPPQVPPEDVEEAKGLAEENRTDHQLLKTIIDRLLGRDVDLIQLLTPPMDHGGGGMGEVELHDCHWPVNKPHGDLVTDPVTGAECFPGHEHGDLPAQWMTDAGVTIQFGGPEATPNENVMKHQAYKLFVIDGTVDQGVYADPARCPGVETPVQKIALRVHAASNPMDRASRFHSYQLFVLDCLGGLSYAQGWYDTGNPGYPGSPSRQSAAAEDDGFRPRIGMVDDAALAINRGCEQWYMFASQVWHEPEGTITNGSPFGPDLGINYCGATVKVVPNEHLTAMDIEAWRQYELTGSNFGHIRLIDVNWYKENDGSPRGGVEPLDQVFYLTQFGERVSGPMDALCGTSVTIAGKTYTRLCLPQKMTAAFTPIGFSTGSTWQHMNSVRNVRLPN